MKKFHSIIFGEKSFSTSELGTKLTIERRYSFQERSSVDKSELKNCNTLAGAKVFGLQAEEGLFKCTNTNLMENDLDSDKVERMLGNVS